MGKILYFPDLKINERWLDSITDPTERYYYDFYVEHGCQYGDTREVFKEWIKEAFQPVEDPE